MEALVGFQHCSQKGQRSRGQTDFYDQVTNLCPEEKKAKLKEHETVFVRNLGATDNRQQTTVK